MKLKILLITLFTFLYKGFFAQNQNVAAIVDEHSNQFDVVFFSKLILVFIISVIALISLMRSRIDDKTRVSK